MQWKTKIEAINKFKSLLFGKYNKINEPVARLIKEEREKLQKILLSRMKYGTYHRFYRI